MLNPNALGENTGIKNISLYITECNFSNNLVIVLNSKGSNNLIYNGKNILSTSKSGLGINFSEVTGGIIRTLELSAKQRIYPERIEDTLYRIDLQAQLVNVIPANQLELGKFTSTITLSIIYD